MMMFWGVFCRVNVFHLLRWLEKTSFPHFEKLFFRYFSGNNFCQKSIIRPNGFIFQGLAKIHVGENFYWLKNCLTTSFQPIQLPSVVRTHSVL